MMSKKKCHLTGTAWCGSEWIWFGAARLGSADQTCIYDDLTCLRTKFEGKSSSYIQVNTIFTPFSIEKEYNPVLTLPPPQLMELCAVEL